MQQIDMENILEILVCSVTKGRLEYDKEKQLLISKQAKLAYQINDGIPDMRIETAIDLSEVDQKDNDEKNRHSNG